MDTRVKPAYDDLKDREFPPGHTGLDPAVRIARGNM